MKAIAHPTESECADHIEKLIAAIRGTQIAKVWFEIKKGKTPITSTKLIAKSIRCSMDFISLVERGVNAPTVDCLERFAKVPRVDVRDLFALGRQIR